MSDNSLERPKSAIGWHAESFDPNMASVRLRIFQPMHALQGLGHEVRQLGDDPADCDTIIFSKSDSPRALSLAEAARRQGRRVIYDVCDNIFEKPPADEQGRLRQERAKALMRQADVVTCATPALAKLLTSAVPEIAGKAEIIADALEESDVSRIPTWTERLHLWRLGKFLRRNAGVLHLVWFGKCKKGYAGIEHLDRLVGLIELAGLSHSVTLTVISNRRRLYRRSARGWRIPKFYLPWSLATFDAALRLHKVAVIPVEANAYTLGKTINRPATALMAGLGVIADSIPAYEELRPFIFLDDWDGGLRHYMECSPNQDRRISEAQAYLRRNYGGEIIAARWEDVVKPRSGDHRSA
jgi:hypothetical protein